MTPDSPCQTVFVPDLPSDEDQLGPHSRIATAIAEIVRAEQGGHSIGLAGAWGAGKSTIIQLVDQELAESEDILVWRFDAWSHAGDPLRRTFLEALIGRLLEENWVEQEEWEKKRKLLGLRRRETETHTLPRLSKLGVVFGLSLLLAPIGIALLSAALRNGVSPFPGPGTFHLGGAIGVTFALAPALIAGGAVAYAAYRSRGKDQASSADAFSSLGALLVQRAATETRAEVIETPDPTSIEFERSFRDLVGEALQDGAKRIVLVIDNLDRVPPQDARAIWSTLRTFVDHGSRTRGLGWLARMWVVIPYDRMGVSKIWSSFEPSATNGNERGRSAHHAEGLVDSFLDKSLQIRFEVPLPLLSDWRRFLVRLLRRALPNHSDEEFHTIYRLVANARSELGAPTPRELKIIVNQIGAQHRLWGDELPLSHLAYYVLLKRRGQDVVSGLRLGTIPEQGDEWLLESGYEGSLATLAFGVPRKKAQQLLLEEPILDALADGDESAIRDLKDREGFETVLEESLVKARYMWRPQDTASFLATVTAIRHSDLLETLSQEARSTLVRGLRSLILAIDAWRPMTESVPAGMVDALNVFQDGRTVQSLVRSLGSSLESVEGSVFSELLPGIIAVAQAVKDLGYADALEAGLPAPGGLEGYLAAMGVCIDRADGNPDSNLLFLFRATEKSEALVEGLIDRVKQGAFERTEHYVVRSLGALRDDMKWAPLSAALTGRLQAGQSVEIEHVNWLLATLLHLEFRYDHKESAEALRALVKEGHLAHQFDSLARGQRWNGTARALFAWSKVDPSLPKQGPTPGRAQHGWAQLDSVFKEPSEALCRSFAQLAENFDAHPLLVKILNQRGDSRRFVGMTLRALGRRGKSESLFTPEFIEKHWQLLEDFAVLEVLFAKKGKPSAAARFLEQSDFSPSKAVLYSRVWETLRYKKKFSKWLIQGLRAVPENTWLEVVESNSAILALGESLQKGGFQLGLGVPLRAALKAVAKATADSATAPDTDIRGAIGLLSRGERQLLAEELYDLARERGGSIAPNFFESFGEWLGQSNALREETGTVTRLLVPLVEQGHLAGLRWLDNALVEEPDLLIGISGEQRALLVRKLKTLAGEASDEALRVVSRSIVEQL